MRTVQGSLSDGDGLIMDMNSIRFKQRSVIKLDMKWNLRSKLIFIVIVKIDCHGGSHTSIIALPLTITEVELNISIPSHGVLSGTKNSGPENWCTATPKSTVSYERAVNKIKTIRGKWNTWFTCLVSDTSTSTSGSCEIIAKNSALDQQCIVFWEICKFDLKSTSPWGIIIPECTSLDFYAAAAGIWLKEHC